MNRPSIRRLLGCAAVFLSMHCAAQATAAPTPHPAFQVKVSGQGQPVILIPGLATSGAVWDDTAQDTTGYAASQRQTLATMITGAADIERVAAWGRSSDRHTVADAMYQLLADDLRADLARISAPTLVLGSWIAYRDYAPRAAIEHTFHQQYQALPGATIAMADQARHFIMYDDPSWMYARIDDFLK